MQKVNSLNGCSRPGITAAIVALFLLLIAGRAPLIARPFYVQLFENSIKESNQGNTTVAAELALEALQLCPPGSSRARIRLHLAEVYIKEEKFAASRCQYELLAKEGQTWLPASIYGVANTSGLLGDERRFKESLDAFIADFSDHPLRSQLEFIKLNPQSEIAFKEQQTSKDEVTE
ncbi:MAG: hypothetical protein EOM80_08985, partial [Erysipelotrichia bacterium]|nr:hypothetical protein [Erysipelotrichia bacterium]